MITLALETSTDYCSIALMQAGKLTVRSTDGTQQGSRLILPLIDELLRERGILPSSLQRLVWSHGPGSFTGLRVGAAVMQGMSYALKLPVTGISSLRALAQTVTHDMQLAVGTRIVVALDARMGDWYVGDYCVQEAGVQSVSSDRLVRADDWHSLAAELNDTPAVLAGAVWQLEHSTVFAKGTRLATGGIPAASALLALLDRCDKSVATMEVQPVYLRGANIWKKTAEQGGVTSVK